MDELLGVLERGAGRTARLIDIPPLELSELRSSLVELRSEADSLPTPKALAALFGALQEEARREDRSLLEVSSGLGLAFLLSARSVGREHLVVPYVEDWEPLRREGFGDYARRVAAPYRDAVTGHLDRSRETHTERVLGEAQSSAPPALFHVRVAGAGVRRADRDHLEAVRVRLEPAHRVLVHATASHGASSRTSSPSFTRPLPATTT